MPDFEALQQTADRVFEQISTEGLSSLEERDHVFFLAWSFAGIVDNGGFPAFFYNSPADYYAETIDALRELGLSEFVELLERAARLQFVGPVPRNMEERNAAMDELPADAAIDDQFEELNRPYFASGGGNRVFDALGRWYFQE